MKHLLAVALFLSALAACAPANRDGSDIPRPQANLITQEQLYEMRHSNLHEVISALRPNWLTQRGTSSLSDPAAGTVVVYLSGSYLGGPEVLRQVIAQDVAAVRFLSAAEAQSRFGTRQNTGPAILIEMRGR